MQTNPSTETLEVKAGLVLGRYELLSPIAAGGMAQVWAARMKGARQFQKIVAVKTMLPKLSEDAQFEQMFLDEASLASQIKHPNAVEIMDLGEQYGVLYLVMEWIEGVPLNQLMKEAKGRGGIPIQIAARIALQAAAGLHAAHELHDDKGRSVGLVHRDVSPQNLLVTYDGVTKVVDFGVAKATALGGGATQAGQVKGKVSYMAPEQVNGEGLDRRADVFALGIVLYALTTGKHPFRRESEAATMYNICSPEPVVPPSSVVSGYPKELEPIVQKALEKDRNKRYLSCDELLRALDSLPPHLRVGSDADVGAYVRELMGDKRAEQKRRIDEALARADAAPAGAWSQGTDLASGVGQVRVQTQTMSGTHDLSGLATGMHPQTLRNRVLGLVGLIALAISGGVFAAMLLNRAEKSADPESEAPPVSSDNAKASALDDGTQLAPVDLRDLPDAEAEVTSPPSSPTADKKPGEAPKPTAEKTITKGVAPQPSPKPKSNTPPAPAAQPKSNWKFDAGF